MSPPGELAAEGPFSVPFKVPLPVKGIITIGQEQDQMAGAYDTDQSFRGHIAQASQREILRHRLLILDAIYQVGNIFSKCEIGFFEKWFNLKTAFQANIWSRALSSDDVRVQASCVKAELGDIFSTDR